MQTTSIILLIHTHPVMLIEDWDLPQIDGVDLKNKTKQKNLNASRLLLLNPGMGFSKAPKLFRNTSPTAFQIAVA